MAERPHASQHQGESMVLVGVFSDRGAALDDLAPAIRDLGWNTVDFDPWSESIDRMDEIDLIVFNLESVGTGTLEKVTEVSLFAQAKMLVISKDRDPQVIADVLRSGADDYLVRPFAIPELEARMYALVTRVWPSTDRRRSRSIAFDVDTRSVSAGPYSVRFTPLEWDVLSILMEHDGEPISAGSVARELEFRNVQKSTIPTVVSRIRRKLTANSFEAISVTTVQNRGYVAQFRRASDHWRNGNGNNSGDGRSLSDAPTPEASASPSAKANRQGMFSSQGNDRARRQL